MIAAFLTHWIVTHAIAAVAGALLHRLGPAIVRMALAWVKSRLGL